MRRAEERSEVELVMVAGVETPHDVPCQQRDPDMLHVNKVDFVECNTLAINCTAQTERKSKKIRIIVSTAEIFCD